MSSEHALCEDQERGAVNGATGPPGEGVAD